MKAFLEEYGVVVVAAIVIMIIVVLAYRHGFPLGRRQPAHAGGIV